VNPEKPYILRAHLLCAAWEIPLTETDERYFGKALAKRKDELTARGVLKERRNKWFLSASISYPAQGHQHPLHFRRKLRR